MNAEVSLDSSFADLLNVWRKYPVRAGLLVSSYSFGAIVLGHQLIPGFVQLTAAHMMFAAGLLVSAHPTVRGPRNSNSTKHLLLWCLGCGILGWGVEYVGVHSGYLFGDYAYGTVLGPALAGIPLVMAINWVLVVYAVCSTVEYLIGSTALFAKIGLAAGTLVALDYLIEPVAIGLGFWFWEAGDPPLHNFIGWFCVGLVQAYGYYAMFGSRRNPLGPLVLLLQFAFFIYLSIVLV